MIFKTFSCDYTIEATRQHPDCLFVFGDNCERKGTGIKSGQSVIRHEPNSFGVVTKRKPKNTPDSFFDDTEKGLELILVDLYRLYNESKNWKCVYFPAGGLGTGRARLNECAPCVFYYMSHLIKRLFGVDYTQYIIKDCSNGFDFRKIWKGVVHQQQILGGERKLFKG